MKFIWSLPAIWFTSITIISTLSNNESAECGVQISHNFNIQMGKLPLNKFQEHSLHVHGEFKIFVKFRPLVHHSNFFYKKLWKKKTLSAPCLYHNLPPPHSSINSLDRIGCVCELTSQCGTCIISAAWEAPIPEILPFLAPWSMGLHQHSSNLHEWQR